MTSRILPLEDYPGCRSITRACPLDKAPAVATLSRRSRKKEIIAWLVVILKDLHPAEDSRGVITPFTTKARIQRTSWVSQFLFTEGRHIMVRTNGLVSGWYLVQIRLSV
jgi:hypothetical protein